MSFLTSFPARCGLAVLSGTAYALAYPPLGWGWFVIPGLAGLLLALQGQHGTRARTIGFLHGMAAFGVGLSWLFQIFGSLVVVMWCVLGGIHRPVCGNAEPCGVGGDSADGSLRASPR